MTDLIKDIANAIKELDNINFAEKAQKAKSSAKPLLIGAIIGAGAIGVLHLFGLLSFITISIAAVFVIAAVIGAGTGLPVSWFFKSLLKGKQVSEEGKEKEKEKEKVEGEVEVEGEEVEGKKNKQEKGKGKARKR